MRAKDGGRLEGPSEQGVLQGDTCRYVYPDGTSLLGAWVDGEMRAARYVAQQDAEGAERQAHVMYRHDVSTDTRLSRDPLQPDPYEQARVTVKASTIPGADEGLFARCTLPANVRPLTQTTTCQNAPLLNP